MAFDPYKVTRIITGCEDYYDTWIPEFPRQNCPEPEWGDNSYDHSTVSTSDYDALLALYTARIDPPKEAQP